MSIKHTFTQAASFVLAAVVTVSMLAGVDHLATQQPGAKPGPLLVQQSAAPAVRG